MATPASKIKTKWRNAATGKSLKVFARESRDGQFATWLANKAHKVLRASKPATPVAAKPGKKA